jgi:hypothetical protein
MKVQIRDDRWTLCQSCKESQIIVDHMGRSRVICHEGMQPREMRMPVARCSRYSQEGRMADWEAEKIGWVLEVKKGVIIGFRKPEPK